MEIFFKRNEIGNVGVLCEKKIFARKKKKICPLVKVCFSHFDSWGEKEVKDIST